MSCGCENDRMRREYDRIRKLAKAWAVMEGRNAILFKEADGAYGFGPAGESDRTILEYITPY